MAGSVAEEVLSNIRTVFAFGGQKSEAKRYGDLLAKAEKDEERKSLVSGFGFGVIMFLVFATYALAFWY